MSKSHAGLWIPLSILFNPAFTAVQKIVLAEVLALQGRGGCFASNARLSKSAGVKERQLRNHLSSLVESGHLRVENGSSKRRRLWVAESVTSAAVDGAGCTAPPSLQSGDYPGANPATPPAETRHVAADSADPTGQDSASDRGTKSTQPAEDCRETRHGIATEITMRTHLKNTHKNTNIAGRIELDFPEWLDAGEWTYWLASCDQRGFSVGPKLQQIQLSELDRLRAEGGNVGAIIRQSIEKGWRSFYAVPALASPRKRSFWAGVR